jgi:hypothetical protein
MKPFSIRGAAAFLAMAVTACGLAGIAQFARVDSYGQEEVTLPRVEISTTKPHTEQHIEAAGTFGSDSI